MVGELVNAEADSFTIPESAAFERAPVLPHDPAVKPTAAGAIHLDGSSQNGDVVEYLNFDDTDGTFTHEMRQDIEPTLNDISRMRLESGNSVGKSKSGEWYHAARVDKVVVLAWLHARGLQWADFKGEIVKRFLNDSNNSAFRLWAGRV